MASTIPPLTKIYPDGRPYHRMDVVEEEIAALSEKGFEEVLRRGVITARGNPDFVRPETLMHFLRATRRDNSDRRFEALYPLVLRRLLLALPRGERRTEKRTEIDAFTADLIDVVRTRFVGLVTLDRTGGDGMDFYEVHFDEAIAGLRMKAWNKLNKKASKTDSLEADDGSGELPEHVEQAAGSYQEDEEDILSDPSYRERVMRGIDRLKPEQKEVMLMSLANIPTESSDPTVPSISGLLGCDPSTVRYRRRRSIVRIQAMLATGELG